MTSGVSMNGLPVGAIAFLFWAARCWLATSPHALAAGDQITGRGPLALGSGQLSVSSDAASPDDFFVTRTAMHSPSTLASESLNRLARSVMRSIFSGDAAMSTVMQSAAAAAPAVAR